MTISVRTTVLSIDPGIRGCGVAVWGDGSLLWASYVKNSAREGAGPTECLQMATEICYLTSQHGFPSVLVVEWPQTYGGRASRGDANDLFPLVGVDCALAMLLRCSAPDPVQIQHLTPHDWKGSVQKPDGVSKPYPVAGMCERRLRADERENVYLPANKRLQWDVWDAVGIGLKFLGRFEKMRAYATE